MTQAIEAEFLNQINEHRSILHKVTKLYVDEAEDRADLFQEILLQLWKAYPKFLAKSKFSTWMYRVALNTAILYFKKAKRQPERSELPENFELADHSDHQHQEERLTYLYKAVQELNAVEKALIFLYLEDLSHKEIADQLGITEGNARVKLNRSKEKLQQIIKKNGYEF